MNKREQNEVGGKCGKELEKGRKRVGKRVFLKKILPCTNQAAPLQILATQELGGIKGKRKP